MPIDFCAAPRTAADTSFLIPYYRAQPVHVELERLGRSGLSLLHPDVLFLLYHFARYANGHVLELGAFTGGATTAMAWGIRESGATRKIVSVDRGGPSRRPGGPKDIIRELRGTVARMKIGAFVTVVAGDCGSADVVREARAALGGESIGLLLVDYGGNVEADITHYLDLMAPGSYVVVDDYLSPGAPYKVAPIRSGLSALEARGVIEPLGVFGWGTWVGRLSGA